MSSTSSQLPFYGEGTEAGSFPSYVAALFKCTTPDSRFVPPLPHFAFNAHHGGVVKEKIMTVILCHACMCTIWA